MLLDKRGDEVPITEKVFKAAAGNRKRGKAVVNLLLERRGDQVRDWVMRFAAKPSGYLARRY